jgi:LysR family glycine cleavage system transcriptional activator
MRHLPSFFSLRAFESAARIESFTLAAQELHQTTSAISHQVRALEAWLGLSLFLRQTRRVSLTPQGQRLLTSLSAGFDLIEKACNELRPREQTLVLSLHCAPSFASQWLGPRLGRFMQAYPAITVHLSSSAQAADLPRDATLDCDIAYGAPPPRPG